jgi:diadenosine tetraphosphate (Ap4A) HIT family hydrolase
MPSLHQRVVLSSLSRWSFTISQERTRCRRPLNGSFNAYQQMTKTSNESPQPTAGLVHTSAYFCVEPCVTCFIPGYLIVTPKLPTASLSELERGALASLGPMLAAATRAIEVVIRPERVYCALFAEETRSVHFHLFPRTAWLLSQYVPCIPQIARFQVHSCWIGLVAHSIVRFRPTTPRLFKRFFVNSTVTPKQAIRLPAGPHTASHQFMKTRSLEFLLAPASRS